MITYYTFVITKFVDILWRELVQLEPCSIIEFGVQFYPVEYIIY